MWGSHDHRGQRNAERYASRFPGNPLPILAAAFTLPSRLPASSQPGPGTAAGCWGAGCGRVWELTARPSVDIPEEEARYWAKKLEQLNAMRDQDEVSRLCGPVWPAAPVAHYPPTSPPETRVREGEGVGRDRLEPLTPPSFLPSVLLP